MQCDVYHGRKYILRLCRNPFLDLKRYAHLPHSFPDLAPGRLPNKGTVLPRPPAKRAAALAGINALSNISQIYSPFLYPCTPPLPLLASN
jgi:hypothetical protein